MWPWGRCGAAVKGRKNRGKIVVISACIKGPARGGSGRRGKGFCDGDEACGAESFRRKLSGNFHGWSEGQAPL